MDNNTTFEQHLDCTLPYEIPQHYWIWYNDYSWWMEGFGSLLVGSIGILLNITTVAVLLGSFLGASFFNWLLVSLALFDSLFLLSGILEAFRNHISQTSFSHHYLFVNFLYPFRSVVMCCSLYMTVILALERYNALARPTAHQHSAIGMRKTTCDFYFQMHWPRLLKYVCPVILLSTIFYIPKYMELYLMKDDRCDTSVNSTIECSEYVVSLTTLRKSDDYVRWYLNVTNLVITTIIPLISLTYLNFNVYLKFKQYIIRQPSTTRRQQPNLDNGMVISNVQERFRKRERDVVQQTMILFVIVILFGLSHVLRIVLNIEEMRSLGEEREALEKGCEWLKFWTIVVAPISHLLLQINSGINFFIYCFFNKAFRNVLISKLCLVFNITKCKRQNQDQTKMETHGLTENIKPKIMITTNAHISHPGIELEDLKPDANTV